MTRQLALVLAASMPLSVVDFASGQEELPITRLTLYRSGVGFFERRGHVDGDGDMQLSFDADQINDILKSMVLLDLDGGRIEAVGYGSREPLNRRLASFGIDISDNPSMATILGRLRGSPVELDIGPNRVKGTVVGVETRKSVYQQGVAIDQPFVSLLTDAGVEPIDLSLVRSMKILDEELAAELKMALGAMAEQRADRVKTVDIALRGSGEREIVAAYVHEMPMWKTSYRLVLPEGPTDAEGEGPGAGMPTIQGWAIVENTTDEDWNDVQLSLVAGRPVSFQMDLYEPLHVERPEIPVPTVPGVAPRVYEGGEVFEARRQLADRADDANERMRAKAMAPAAAAEGGVGLARDSGITADQMVDYAARAQASASESGEVFQYELDAPVTVERQRSAMLPILSTGIEGRRVSIFNRADGSKHPMRGVELTNSTGLQLMPGPISVFDDAAYAGDAQIGHVSPGDERLLAYAVDLEVDSLVTDDGTSRVQKVRIVDGLIEQRIERSSTTKYAFSNKDEKRARTMVIEHPKSGGWTLAAPEKPVEETEALYRFELALEAGEKDVLEVKIERTDLSRVELISFDIATLVSFVKNGTASQEVLDAVREAGRLNGEILATKRAIGALDDEVRRITDDQTRVRQNMNSIDRTSQLYNRYVTKLNEQESRLEQITTERAGLEAKVVEQEKALRDYLKGLNVS
jgi:hypothetical protein